MIIKKYFNKELIYTSLGIVSVLLVIFIGHTSLKYLKYALKGFFPISYIIEMIILEIPYLLSLLIPLGFFLSALIVYSRMYAEQEMIIWLTSGISRKSILNLAMRNALWVSIFVSILSIWLGPASINALSNLRHVAKSDIIAKMFVPGQFTPMDYGLKVAYVDRFTSNKEKAEGIFIAEHSKKVDNKGYDFTILVADMGQIAADNESGKQYALLTKGYRYSIEHSQDIFHIVEFDEYMSELPRLNIERKMKEDIMPFNKLLDTSVGNLPFKMAELHWRIAHPISVIIFMLIAFSISKTAPRAGRYSRIIPGVMVYIGYYNLLFFGRNIIREGTVSPIVGLWWVHLLFLGLGILFFNYQNIRNFIKGSRLQ